MFTGTELTGILILATGIALILLMLVKFWPRIKQLDTDTSTLIGIFTLLAIGLLGLGGWLSFSGLLH